MLKVKESNVSNISKALAVVTLLAPVPGLPLSIGDIQLHSALNQSLNAEIRLKLDGGESPSDVAVRMASPEKFDKAGIPWSYFLTKIKFDLVVLSDGAINVKLSSRESLTEPFLDFLLEVSWSQGSQYREFTLLIDPPAEYKSANLPFAENMAYRPESVYSVARPERKSRPAVERINRPAATNQNKPQISTSGEFGPVQKNTNLWKIAVELSKERGISSGQMMSELYNANPEAFYHNDPNALKAGVILKIPVGNPGQHRVSTSSESKNISQESTGNEKPLKLIAPGEAKVADNGELYGAGGQAKVGTANDQAALGDSGKAADAKSLELQSRVENLERQLNMMQQLLALKDQQLSQLQNTKVQPNSPVSVPVAPQQPVDVAPPVAQPRVPPVAPQNTVPTPPVSEEPQTQPPVVTPEVKPVVSTPVPPPVVNVAPKPAAPQVPAPQVAAEESFISSESYYISVATFGFSVLGVLGWLLWRKRRIDEQTYTESMFASASQITMPESESTLTVPVMELESPVTYDVGTVGESSFISDFTPSDFDAFDTDQNEIDPLSEADVYLAYGRYQQAEELIRNALNHDPGRDTYKLKLLEIYYAAENKDAFIKYSEVLAKDGKESDRAFWNKVSEMGKELVPEIALFGGASVTAPITTAKVVNVAKTGNVDLVKQNTSGASTSTSIESLLDNDYLAALDSSLALDTAIPEDLTNEFSDLKQAFSKASNQQIDQLDFDFSSSDAKFGIADADLDEMTLKFSADSEMPEEMLVDYADYKLDSTEESAFDNDQGADLAALTSDAESRKPTDIEPTANNEAIDFDLSSLSFDSREEHAKDTDQDLELETFNFNFDLDEIGKASNQEAPEIIVTPQTASLEIAENHNLSVNSTFEPDISAIHAMKPQALEEDSFSEFDFSFDFDTPLENKDSEFSKDSEFFDLNVSDLTDMDEFETKIDLAKAYVDMGDATAAKVIAEEVLGKGTRDQKLAAQALLDELR